MPDDFIFVVCQHGAEAACKQELAQHHPGLRFAFSRPGFLTFKAGDAKLPKRFSLKTTFARTYGWSLGKEQNASGEQMIASVVERIKQLPDVKHLHVWQRDQDVPGSRGFEPVPTVFATEMAQQIVAAAKTAGVELVANRNAGVDETVFDLTIVEPDQWWCGYHVAGSPAGRWPGGAPLIRDFEETEVVNRAYYKLFEALLWSGIHVKPGDVCAEIGSAPGGACQLLLEKEAKVIAVDPAEMEPEIAKHKNLTYIRSRGKEVKKRDLKDVRWLIVDLNAAPKYTLDTIEDIATNQNVTKVVGVILTIKISDWKMVSEIPDWIARVKSFGFQHVRTRQLAFSRREICLVGVRDRFAIRKGKKVTAKKVTAKKTTAKKASSSKKVPTSNKAPSPRGEGARRADEGKANESELGS